METKKNPLSPHLQIYRWHISSLLSITHRIVGVINILAISLICFGIIYINVRELNDENLQFYLQNIFGKFIIISLCWTFSFHILNEIRHLFWDMGYGFDLNVSRITGILTIFGSFVLTIIFYLIGKNVF